MDFALRLPSAGEVRSLAHAATVFAILAAAGCGAEAGEETALLRGDRAFAHGDYEEALAEYRLSMLRGNPGGEAEMRAAHAYAALDRIDEASSLYRRAVRGDSASADQAVSDLVAAAIRARAGGDSYGMASAIEAAQSLRKGIVVEELALVLARHYSETGQGARARPLYLRALGADPTDPEVVFETALAHVEIGDCESALLYLATFGELAPDRSSEANWHNGWCSYELFRERRSQGHVEEAVKLLEAVIRYEEPRTHLPQAYFDRAELLSEMGNCAAAVEAYRAVATRFGGAHGALARRALDRMDSIRFGVGTEGGAGAC